MEYYNVKTAMTVDYGNKEVKEVLSITSENLIQYLRKYYKSEAFNIEYCKKRVKEINNIKNREIMLAELKI